MDKSYAVAGATEAASRLKRMTATAVQVAGPRETSFARPASLTTRERAMTSTAGNSNRFVSRRKSCRRLLSSGDGAPILLSLVGPRRCLATRAAAGSGRTWPLCREQGGPRAVARQSLDSVIQHLERRYVEVERLDDLEAFLAIIEKAAKRPPRGIF